MVSEEKALKKCPIFQYFLLGVFLKNQRQITHSYLMDHEYQAKSRRGTKSCALYYTGTIKYPTWGILRNFT